MNKHTILGIISPPIGDSVEAWAIDGKTGEPIVNHTSQNEYLAQHDLGFSESPIEESRDYYIKNREIYSTKYPDGYELVWVGDYVNNKLVNGLIVDYLRNYDKRGVQ